MRRPMMGILRLGSSGSKLVLLVDTRIHGFGAAWCIVEHLT